MVAASRSATSNVRLLAALACLLAAAAASGSCREPRPVVTPPVPSVRVIPLDTVRPLPRTPLGAIRGYPEALGSALSVIEGDLGFPTLATSVYIFPDREALRRDLERAGYRPGDAARVASALDGISSSGRIRINDDAMGRLPWPARVRLLAHELAHVAQYQLSGGRRAGSDQWLREGFAEWTGYRVLEALGARNLSLEREAALLSLRPAARFAPLPTLAQLVSADDWVAAIERARPASPVYSVAFLAADELVVRHGVRSVLRYFALSASSADRDANFAAAFDEPLRQFARQTERRLARFVDDRDPVSNAPPSRVRRDPR